MGRIHYGDVKNSERLRSVLKFLRRRKKRGATTWEIIENCGVAAVSTAISEIRASERIEIRCKLERVNEDKTRVYRYWVIE